MRGKTTIAVFALCLFAAAAISGPPGQTELNDRVIKLIREYYPDAEIATDDGNLTAKYRTMVFTVHGSLKSREGGFQAKTYKVEGPNTEGFMLSISVKSGKYKGQLGVPDTVRKPYWQTYIDCPPTENEKGYYEIRFSYGDSLDPKFIKALFEILPKTKTPGKESS